MKFIQTFVNGKLINGSQIRMWMGDLDFDRAVIIDAESAADETVKSMFRIVCPASKRLSVIPREKAISNFLSNAYGNERLLLFVKDISILEEISSAKVQPGNINFISSKGEVELVKGVSLNKDDLKRCSILLENGNTLFSQPIPDADRVDLKDMILQKSAE